MAQVPKIVAGRFFLAHLPTLQVLKSSASVRERELIVYFRLTEAELPAPTPGRKVYAVYLPDTRHNRSLVDSRSPRPNQAS